MSFSQTREIAPATATAVTDAGATEAVAVVSSPVSTPGGGATVELHAQVAITPGASATAVTLRVRRGNGITGAIVGTAEVDTLAAAAKGILPIIVEDQPGDVAGLVYSVTVQETGATGNGTVGYAFVGGLVY